jgi:hypothetical protein
MWRVIHGAPSSPWPRYPDYRLFDDPTEPGYVTDLAKEAFLDELKATICIHCGRKQAKTSSRCQCWNDD